MSTAVSAHTGAGPLSLMSCVRESSPPQDLETEYEIEKNVPGQKKKRFWNRWFSKRKNKVQDDVPPSSSPCETIVDMPKDSQRSRSTSELSETEEQQPHVTSRRRNGAPMHPGLSVSHDSVFHSPHSGSDLELEGTQSSSSLSIHHQHQADRLLQTELTERLRLRRGRGDTSEDDEGLPRSPCNSPSATEKTTIKDNPKSHSTCSEGSLLSVGSSEMDEDSFGQHSIHSSKLSLDDRNNTTETDFDAYLSLKNTSAPLNHSGAWHKASVKPQRRHGAPRKKRLSGSVLPTTPEVNEDNAVRSITPEVSSMKETVTELYQTASSAVTTTAAVSSSRSTSRSGRVLTEKQLKCSSLPPGLAPPGSEAAAKLNRSRSNAGTKYQEEFAALGEEEESGKDAKKSGDSFLGRIFPRRSLKKKKSKEEKIITTSSSVLSKQTEIVESSQTIVKETRSESLNVVKPIPIPRSGPAARQRIQPNDIPASPELGGRPEDALSKSPISPLQIELENHLQQRLASLSTSPKFSIKTPPISPKIHRKSPPLVSPPKSPNVYPKIPSKSHLLEKAMQIRSEETKSSSKVVITGLSAFQQRAINNKDSEGDDADGSKSLELPSESIRPTKLVSKSHSFKISNHGYGSSPPGGGVESANNRITTTFAELASTRSFHETQTTTTSTVSVEPLKIEKIERPIEIPDDNDLDIAEKSKEDVNVEAKIDHPELESPRKVKELLSKTPSPVESKDFKFVQKESKESVDASNFMSSGITISGPRHKAIVSVTNHHHQETVSSTTTEVKNEFSEVKQEQVSVTKIQVKQESSQSMQTKTATAVPEFMNIQLHKVEKAANNVVLTAGFQNSSKDEEQNKISPEAVIQDLPITKSTSMEVTDPDLSPSTESSRKFSKEDIEIVDKTESDEDRKHVATALVTITTMTPPVPTRVFKKSDYHLRKSLINVASAEKPVLKTKSSSLDIVESIKCSEDSKIDDRMEMKAKTQSVNDLNESSSEPAVPLRRKSAARQRQDDEPELMKVFARRSLKLKDSESESLSQQVIKMLEESQDKLADVKSRDSDKENHLDSPSEERKKIQNPTQKDQQAKSKDPLLENKFAEPSTIDVALRKPVSATINNNNKLYSSYQRAVSMNNAKTNDLNNYERMQKQNSLLDGRPKTEQWIAYKQGDGDSCPKICQEEIISTISEKTLIEREEFCTKPKNFNQRKAEWEKRAQEASRKTTP